MATHLGRLRLTHYDGGDSPKWINDPDGEASYNEDMAKIEAWAAAIDPVAGPTKLPAISDAGEGSKGTLPEGDLRKAFALEDHKHQVLVGTTSTDVSVDVAGGVGTATSLARSSHTHRITTAPAISLTIPGSNSRGSGTALAKANHTHALPNFGTAGGEICEGNDGRLVDLDNALMKGIEAPRTTHIHDAQYSKLNHTHEFIVPAKIIKMDTITFDSTNWGNFTLKYNDTTQQGEWTWFPSLYVGDVLPGQTIQLEGMARATSEITVGVGIIENFPGTPYTNADVAHMKRLFTSAFGGRSANVSQIYRYTGETKLENVRIILGVRSQTKGASTVTVGSYGEQERYCALSYILYDALPIS